MSSEIRQQIDDVIKDMPLVTPIGSAQLVKASMPEAVEWIVEHLWPEKVILFGSYGFGSPTSDSDLDLLIVMNNDSSDKPECHWQVSKLLMPRPFPVDIVVQAPEELRRALNKGHYFYTDIVKTGQVLYERLT